MNESFSGLVFGGVIASVIWGVLIAIYIFGYLDIALGFIIAVIIIGLIES